MGGREGKGVKGNAATKSVCVIRESSMRKIDVRKEIVRETWSSTFR